MIFSGLDLDQLINAHKKSNSLATVVLAKSRTPTRFGAVELDSENRVVSFVEKPRKQTVGETWVNAGVYVIRPSVFAKIPKGKRSSLELDVFPKLMRGNDLRIQTRRLLGRCWNARRLLASSKGPAYRSAKAKRNFARCDLKTCSR